MGKAEEKKEESKEEELKVDIEYPTEKEICIGQRVQCKITGYLGIITVKIYNLYRVPQYCVSQKMNMLSSSKDSYIFDRVQLRILEKKPVVAVVEPEQIIKLGQKAKCTVTNFTGVVIAREVHMNGCVRLKIRDEYRPGDETSMTVFKFDEGGVDLIEDVKTPVKPNKQTSTRGCAMTKYDGF